MEESELTLRDLLHRAAHNYPDSEAVADGVFRYTYAQLLDRVQRMAKLLHQRGVRKGDRVALLQPACSAHLIALFGAIELGAIPCALHVRESESILGAILQRLSARVLVCDGAYAHTGRALQANSAAPLNLVFGASALTPAATGAVDEPVIPQCLDQVELDFEPMPLTADDVAVIALSSGTTGIPKGVMHTHRTLTASARCGALYMLADEHACTINIFSTAFIGWYNCTLPFICGASRIVYLSQWDPAHYLQTIEREQATVCFLVPTMWRMLLREQPAAYDLSSLQLVGYAGEPMDLATMTQIRETVCASVLNTYGTTETGSWGGCTVMLPADYAGNDKIASVGRPGEGVEIRVITPGGSTADALARGDVGEVIISGPSVASQLWEQPQLSRRVFDGRWWRSGDLGYLDEDGYLYLSGRTDDMIISGGINVLPGPVEAVLLDHPSVIECAVIGVADDRYGQTITAFVQCREPLSERELAEHVAQSSLSSYKKPRRYVFVDELPRGNTGKVSRKLLRDKVIKGDVRKR
ncbi:MAG: acyl--CoA ligase [Halioglobus sp.]|nr:acyl--CoA ligase [Halioglobus sp.]